MRKEYKKLLREGFLKVINSIQTGFELYKEKSEYLWSGQTAYKWEASEDAWIFFVLFVDPRGVQAFTLNVGWSKMKRFPHVIARADLVAEKNLFQHSEFLMRVGFPFFGRDLWWNLESPDGDGSLARHVMPPAEAERNIFTCLKDVETQLRSRIFPFLLDCIAASDT